MSITNQPGQGNGPQGNQQGNQPGQLGGQEGQEGSIEFDDEDQPTGGADDEEE